MKQRIMADFLVAVVNKCLEINVYVVILDLFFLSYILITALVLSGVWH